VSPSRLTRRIARTSERMGPLRGLPVVRLLAAAEVLMLARQHVTQLEPAERRRLVELVREGRGRRSNLTPAQRDELADLVAKAEPRQFLTEAASKFSPVRIPDRLVQGRRRRGSSR
jgi:hypothetical protein